VSSPGWVMAFFFVISAITVCCFFKEPRKRKETKEVQSTSGMSFLEEWAIIFSKFPCLVIITAQFLVVFNQTSVETILTPLTKMWYDFDTWHNSFLFAAMTVMIIIWLIAVTFLTKCFQDRTLLMWGHLMTGSSIAVTVLFIALSVRQDLYIPLWQWGLGASLFVSSIPFYESVLGSLFSKLLDTPALDGRGQSIMASTKATASIFGPIVGAAIFRVNKGFAYVELMMGIMWFVVFVMLVISWKNMYVIRIGSVVIDEEKSKLVLAKSQTAFSTQGADHEDEISEVSLDSESGKAYKVTMN